VPFVGFPTGSAQEVNIVHRRQRRVAFNRVEHICANIQSVALWLGFGHSVKSGKIRHCSGVVGRPDEKVRFRPWSTTICLRHPHTASCPGVWYLWCSRLVMCRYLSYFSCGAWHWWEWCHEQLGLECTLPWLVSVAGRHFSILHAIVGRGISGRSSPVPVVLTPCHTLAVSSILAVSLHRKTRL
jgi:hypothetical protein